MASPKMNPQDKKDLDKFTKFLALKSAQIIVQSRLGEKVQTRCNPHTTGLDWFSLAVNDLPDVSAEAKKALYGESGIVRLPLCVEISLRTVDGDQMILETWTLGLISDQCDPSAKVKCTVYNRMGNLLKSLISVTRVTPAYKLSRRQGPDSYVIYYRIYMGEPQLHNLGDGYKEGRVGQLITPVGILYMSVVYRTQMTITPMQSQQDTSIMVKSDHFHTDLSPRHVRCRHSEKKKVNLDKPMKAGAFVDVSKIKQYTEADFILPEEPPFGWLLEDSRKKIENVDPTTSDLGDGLSSERVENGHDKDQSKENGRPIPQKKNSIWSLGAEDDKLMKVLDFPFATTDRSPIGELANFFRDCYHAPPLQTFDDNLSDIEVLPGSEIPDVVADVTSQLEMFEISLQEYDEMVTSLCHSPNNN